MRCVSKTKTNSKIRINKSAHICVFFLATKTVLNVKMDAFDMTDIAVSKQVKF